MGTRNRRRRAEKQRRRQHASAPRPGRHFDQLSIREVIQAAASASLNPNDGARSYRELLTTLADGPAHVATELDLMLQEALRRAQAERHWDTYELRRQAARRLGDRHARFLNDVIRGPGTEPLLHKSVSLDGATGIDSLARAIEVLALLLSLPTLPRFGSGSGPAGRPKGGGGDPRMLAKVRALLAKAESTTFPEEAEALSAKAQELMARHAIDAAMVDAEAGARRRPGSACGSTTPTRAKSLLLAEVASANRCRAVWSSDLGFTTVIGFESDLDLRGGPLHVAAGPGHVGDGGRRFPGRPLRPIPHPVVPHVVPCRLRDPYRPTPASRRGGQPSRGAGVLGRRARAGARRPVVGGRGRLRSVFPHLMKRSVSTTNLAGWHAGAAAADLATLSSRPEVRGA